MKMFVFMGISLAALMLGGAATLGGTAEGSTPPKPLPRVVVYVESQGLCYDSIVTAQNLPNHGPFQVLAPDPANHCGTTPALKTDVGPRDVGYVGGRWMMTMPDGSVVRFLCPLIGPGWDPAS